MTIRFFRFEQSQIQKVLQNLEFKKQSDERYTSTTYF